jgi:hypothetical protein
MGLGAGQVYNRLPLFVMPDGAEELMSHEQDLLEAAPDLLPLPFEDFLLDFPFGTKALLKVLVGAENLDRGRLWVRVRRVSSIHTDAATQIALSHLKIDDDPAVWMLLEGWEEKTTTGGISISPDHSLVSLRKPDFGDLLTYRHGYPNSECWDLRLWSKFWCNMKLCRRNDAQTSRCAASELIHAVMCRLAVLSLIYLSEGLGGLTTEVLWRPTPGSREEKTERLKPWVVGRRQTFILIDPDRSGEYGHPSSILPTSPGHHSSPIPHPRRGHWRRLTPDRKTWVRPAWVGATEWQYEGRTYRIRAR